MKSRFELIRKQLREWICDHGRIALFAIVLTTVVCASIYLSRFIPVEVFETTITFALHLCVLGVCVVGAIVMNWHIYGIKARRVWQGSLILMALIEVSMLVAEKVFCLPTIIFGVHTLDVQDLLVRDLIACLLLVYPTEVLIRRIDRQYPQISQDDGGELLIGREHCPAVGEGISGDADHQRDAVYLSVLYESSYAPVHAAVAGAGAIHVQHRTDHCPPQSVERYSAG